MTFHSLAFAVFLLVVLAASWLLAPHRRARHVLLLVASYVFYGCWHVWYLTLIAASTLLDYHCGRAIGASADPRSRRFWLGCSLAGNLGLLSLFKYWDWGVASLSALLSSLGLPVSLPLLELAVPVGISFYTFQTLSYTIDVYRGRLAPRDDLVDFALFVSFFPQLVAGPIVRAVHFLPQLDRPPLFDRARLHDGLYRIGLGLVKKVVLADVIGRQLVDPVWADPGAWGPLAHVVALYGFTFQIYGDFAGYSDIAVGSARLFGFDLPENFRTPFQSRSVREFWQRWHISLSTWVRDYIYFPLGGSRGTPGRTYRNLVVTMLVIGLWHGASGLWVLYGLLNGLVMSLERSAALRRRTAEVTGLLPSAWGWLKQYHFFVLTLLLVRGESWGQVRGLLVDFGPQAALPSWGLLALAVAAAGHFLPNAVGLRVHRAVLALPTVLVGLLFGALAAFVAVVNIGDTPYIYFQF